MKRCFREKKGEKTQRKREKKARKKTKRRGEEVGKEERKVRVIQAKEQRQKGKKINRAGGKKKDVKKGNSDIFMS